MELRAHLRKLLTHSAIYGAADVFGSAVNFFLLPLYTRLLRPADYGDLALLFLFSTVAKIVFRLGLDAGFFRIHYTLDAEEDRRRLAGTVLLFAGAAGAALFLATVLLRGPLAALLLGRPQGGGLLVLAAADVAVGTLAFVPLALLRIQDRPQLFSALSAARHLLNTALKVALLVGGWGVAGVLWSDLLATAAFTAALLPIAVRHAAFRPSARLLGETLSFGLPKVPHLFLVQVLNLADRKILDLFVTRAQVGFYQVGYTVGSLVKFAPSAFEPAWQPFVYAQSRHPEGRATLARVVTYAFAGFLAAGLGVAVLGPGLLRLMAAPEFHAAAAVVPLVALAYVLHGAFLITSVGIGISRQTRYYPLVTAAAAAVNVTANLLLVPRAGILGAAWATVMSFAVMLGLGLFFSQRVHPLPLEAGRMLRLAGSAALTYAAAAAMPGPATAAASLALFPLLVVASGFLRAGERARLARLLWPGRLL